MAIAFSSLLRYPGALVLCMLSALGLAQSASDEDLTTLAPVFQRDDILQVRVEAPLPDILRSRGEDAEYFPATLFYRAADPEEVAAALRIKTRGNFRNRASVCRFPPLMLNFLRPEVDATIFAGENRLKLVTHCQARPRYDQYLLLEYLNYRIYNLLSANSLKVRLLELDYVNSTTGAPLYVKQGFIIEDSGRFAARRGLFEVTLQRARRAWYDPESALLVGVFQYLIGNTDWSLLVGAPDDSCCHNMLALQSGSGALIAVPYDLDVTGSVDPDYGRPPPSLPIRHLTQRLWRGGCPEPDLLGTVLQRFRDNKAAILTLYAEQPGLTEQVRRKALTFIEQFYAVIDDEGRVQSEFFDACG